MSGIELEHTAALAALTHLLNDSEEQQRLHAQSEPSLPAAACGRDFTDRGAAIAEMLRGIHAAGTSRIDALRDTTDAAATQVRVLRDVDKQFGGELS
ncbi:MAG: hypothetical protein Q4G50_12365 [Corynebacterium sp.]|uniref:hypothetical protein n=1 Tax=Corynebacterium sp. TaxID=1720 RepID=UPI0026E0F5C1|nr:hypothetical protein [Corynebacterium sp.]MDO5670779.1 hypothetical protein [Corynebacterium sp.]